MNNEILKILSFRISGRFAHFRKFYTNSSSLSYLVPPRSAIIGMLASILKYKRDEYYDIFDPILFKIGVSVNSGVKIKKQVQIVNYLHAKYYRLLLSGSGKPKAIHSPCKLELLLSSVNNIEYIVYIGVADQTALTILEKIERKLEARDFGYGVYLGQRQFRANIDQIKKYDKSKITFIADSDYIDSLCMQAYSEPNVNTESAISLITDQMPLHMQKETPGKKKKANIDLGRTLHSTGQVIFEKNGKRIKGKFKNCYQIDDKVIAFYEDCKKWKSS